MLRNYHNQKKMTVNHGVLGSSPCAGALKNKHLQDFLQVLVVYFQFVLVSYSVFQIVSLSVCFLCPAILSPAEVIGDCYAVTS